MAAAREARRRGVDDVVFTSTEGLALEAPRAALIWRRGDALATTCHDGTGVLASITQAAVFAGAATDGIATSYELIAADELRDVDGAVSRRYAPDVLPDLPREQVPIASNLIIDREGRIRFYSLLDSMNFDAKLVALRARLDALLAEETP